MTVAGTIGTTKDRKPRTRKTLAERVAKHEAAARRYRTMADKHDKAAVALRNEQREKGKRLIAEADGPKGVAVE